MGVVTLLGLCEFDLIYIFNLRAIGYSCSSLPGGTHYNT